MTLFLLLASLTASADLISPLPQGEVQFTALLGNLAHGHKQLRHVIERTVDGRRDAARHAGGTYEILGVEVVDIDGYFRIQERIRDGRGCREGVIFFHALDWRVEWHDCCPGAPCERAPADWLYHIGQLVEQTDVKRLQEFVDPQRGMSVDVQWVRGVGLPWGKRRGVLREWDTDLVAGLNIPDGPANSPFAPELTTCPSRFGPSGYAKCTVFRPAFGYFGEVTLKRTAAGVYLIRLYGYPAE